VYLDGIFINKRLVTIFYNKKDFHLAQTGLRNYNDNQYVISS